MEENGGEFFYSRNYTVRQQDCNENVATLWETAFKDFSMINIEQVFHFVWLNIVMISAWFWKAFESVRSKVTRLTSNGWLRNDGPYCIKSDEIRQFRSTA